MAAALAYNFSANLSGFAICLAAAFCGSFGGSRLCGLRIDEEFSSTCLSDGAIRFCSIALLAAIGEATSVDLTFAETSVGAIMCQTAKQRESRSTNYVPNSSRRSS